MIELSYYSKCDRPQEQTIITLPEALDLIKSEKFKEHCEKLRKIKDKDERSKYKRENLPAVTFGGRFSYRNKEKLIYASGICVLDIDEYEKAETIKAEIIKDKYVEFALYSPSKGLKIGVCIPTTKDAEEYEVAYLQVVDHFKKYSPKSDTSTKDISRLCFLSYDPELYINYEAEAFPVDFSKKEEQPEKIISNSEIPNYCIVIEKHLCKIKFPSGEKTRHAYLDGNVWQYSKNKPAVLEAYKKTQGRENSAFNDGDKWEFSCGVIIKYLIGNKEVACVKAALSECEKCENRKENTDLELGSLKEYLDNGVKEIEWRVKNILPTRGITFLGGTAGSLKTFTAMVMALSIASGKDFLGEFETKQCNVLLIDEENGITTSINRFSKLKGGMNFEHNFTNLQISTFNDVKLDTEDFSKLKFLIEKTKPEVVICDSMVRMMSGEEDKSSDVRKVFDNLKSIMKEKEISFVLLHHTIKGNKQTIHTLRGSGDFAAFADVILMFSNTKSNTDVEVVKNRHIDRMEYPKFSLRLEDKGDNLVLNYIAQNPDELNAIRECRVDIIEWYVEAKVEEFRSGVVLPKMKALGHSKCSFYAALSELEKDKEISKPKRGIYKVENPAFIVKSEVIEE